MASGLNEGFANLIVVQAEATLGGTLTGNAYKIPGLTSYSYQPVLGGGLPSVGIYRTQDGDSYSARSFQGSLEFEYGHNEAVALLLASILKRSGTSPNYTFSQSHLSDRQTLALSLHYIPNNQYVVMRGLIVEMFQITLRMREIVKCRVEFKAASMSSSAPIAATSSPAPAPLGGYIGAAQYRSVTMTRANEGSAQISNRIDFTNFGEDAVPTGYEPVGGLTISAEVGEWMADDATAGDLIPADVRNMTEVHQRLSFVPAVGKLFQLNLPRNIVRSGTPPGLQAGGIGYRLSSEMQSGEAGANWPLLTFTL